MPGHTLALRLAEADEKEEKATGIILFAGAFLSLMLSAVVSVFLSDEMQLWLTADGGLSALLSPKVLPTIVSLPLLVLGHFCWLIHEVGGWWKWSKVARNLRLGYRGEHAVAEALAALPERGYRIFHDFPEKTPGNIDHIVIGPGGVFAVDPYAYLRDVLSRLPSMTTGQIASITPAAWAKSANIPSQLAA